MEYVFFHLCILDITMIPSWCLVNVLNNWMEWRNAYWIQFGQFTWKQQCDYCEQDEMVAFSESCNVKCFWKLALLPIENFNQVKLKPCIRTPRSLVVHEVAVLLWKPWETCFFHSLFSIKFVVLSSQVSSLRKQWRYLVIVILTQWVQKSSIIIRC